MTLDQTVTAMHNAFGSPESSREANNERQHRGSRSTATRQLSNRSTQPAIPHHAQDIIDSLTGPALAELATRFMSNFEAELNTLELDDEWTEVPDFYAIVQQIVFKASTKALFGTHIFELNPDITAEFWEYDEWMPSLFKNIPCFFIPKAFQARDKSSPRSRNGTHQRTSAAI